MERRAQVWEARTGRVRATLPLRVHPRQIALTRDSRLLAVAGQGVLEVWDLALEKRVARFDLPREPILALAFAPDGKTLASGGREPWALLWDVSGLAEPLKLNEKDELGPLWLVLAGEDADRAYQMTWKLSAGGRPAADLLRRRLASLRPPDKRFVAQRIAELAHPRYRVREAAEVDLEVWGAQVVQALRDALDDADLPLDVRRRMERALARATARGRNCAPAEAIASRGVEALERMATPEAREALAELAKGPADAPATPQAKAALARLGGAAP
jgi:hypothetical protein